jgi:integrase
MNWLQPRPGPNPLRFVQKVELNGRQKRERRAFTADELETLCSVSGRRGFVYRIGARTGIRRGDSMKSSCGTFTWKQRCLSSLFAPRFQRTTSTRCNPTLTPDAVQVLRELISDDARPTDRVFKSLIPRMPRFRADLEAAGIPYVDGRGEYADFRSLRKTFGTMLTLAGVGQRTVMELMRHSDMRLTAKTYTDANMLPVSDAVALLSAFAAKRENPQIDPRNSGTESRGVSACVANSPEKAKNARCRVRTCDLSPRRPLRNLTLPMSPAL